jgi:hypothetical protein
MDRMAADANHNPVGTVPPARPDYGFVGGGIPVRIHGDLEAAVHQRPGQVLQPLAMSLHETLPGVGECATILEVPAVDVLIMDALEQYDAGLETARQLLGPGDQEGLVANRIQADKKYSRRLHDLANLVPLPYIDPSQV